MNEKTITYKGPSLSGFCMQISILLKSAVPLYEGLRVMAEDEADPRKKELLTAFSDQARMGLPFSQTVKESGCFPDYVVNMALLGERTGLLDVTMERLAAHYEKEYQLSETIRRAVTYPATMILMLLIILFVLFTKVMPIFAGVYEQLGAAISPGGLIAIRLGSVLSGAALVFFALLTLLFLAFWIMKKYGRHTRWTFAVLDRIKSRSVISQSAAFRRFCSVMAMSLQCGVSMPEACRIAEHLVDHPAIGKKVKACSGFLSSGISFYESVKQAGLFTGFQLQLIRVGSRTGHLERIMDGLTEDYDQKASDSIDHMIARLEPTIVSILAVAVGLVLLAVMLPLAGALSSIV